jgi:hypothetical protein
VEFTRVVARDVLLCQNSSTTMHPKVLISNDREESTQVTYNRKPIFYPSLARKRLLTKYRYSPVTYRYTLVAFAGAKPMRGGFGPDDIPAGSIAS